MMRPCTGAGSRSASRPSARSTRRATTTSTRPPTPGYNSRGKESVYNPYAILHLFASREFEAHWFETATPRFLLDTLLGRGFAAADIENIHASAALLSTFDVDTMAPEALLFQTGYLTIAAEEKDADGVPEYRLGYPNREVRRGLNRGLLDALAPNWRSASGIALRRTLAAEDWNGLEALFRKLLAGPASYTGGAALAQLKARRYADKYRAPGRTVHLIGVEIGAATRNITAFDVESE